ncbi:MAG: response regulator [Candidatus Eiseniibacteriota bacterium]
MTDAPQAIETDNLDFVEVPVVDNKSKIIVTVDDDQDILDMISGVARRAGFTVYTVNNSEKALRLLARVVPKLIMLDVQMPSLNGFELCRRIRAAQHLERVPVAFLTAQKTAADVKRGIGVGGDDFLLKPINPFELVNRIQHWTTHGRRQE